MNGTFQITCKNYFCYNSLMVDLSNFELCILLDLYYRRNKLISVDSAPEKSTELYCEILNNLYQKIIKDENKFLELDKEKNV